MLHLKIFIASILVCLQSVRAIADEFPLKQLKESIPLTSDEAVIKANWLPICQQLEVNVPETGNVVYGPQNSPEVAISYIDDEAQNVNNCDPPNGLGLKNLFKESTSLLPQNRLRTIIQCSLKDAEVMRFKELITSKIFRAKVHDFLQSSHFIIFRDYICKMLNLDIKHYEQFVRNLFAIEQLKEPIEYDRECKTRAGITALIQDLHDALPKQQLRDLYARLLITDEFLVGAVRNMKSNEFRQLLINVAKTKEFNDLRGMLVERSVPLKNVKELIDTALGWYGDEFGYNEIEKI